MSRFPSLSRRLRPLVGLAFWCGLGVLLWCVIGSGEAAPSVHRLCSDLRQYCGAGRRVELRLGEPCDVAVGDPLLADDGRGGLRQVGIVTAVARDGRPLQQTLGPANEVQAVLFSSAPAVPEGVTVRYISPPDSIEWVARTLLPPERQQQILGEMRAALEAHGEELGRALRPIAERSIREALAAIAAELPGALERHRGELAAIAARYRHDVVEKKLVPLAREEIEPIVWRHAEPTMRQVGEEMWKEVSLWRFAWRAVADKMPFDKRRTRVVEEFERFMKDKGVPVLERHQDEFLTIAEQCLRDMAGNDKITSAVGDLFAQALHDDELKDVFLAVLKEVTVNNQRLTESLQRNLSSPETERLMALASERLEPTVKRIGAMVLGTRQEGLTPEFTRVLRIAILFKDRRGFLLGDVPSLPEAQAVAVWAKVNP